MATREKHVYKTPEVFHLYASANKDYASNGRNGNVHFIGDAFYSYSTPMALRVKTVTGETVVLLSGRTYSNTTTGHQNDLRQALRGRHTFTLDECKRGGQNHEADDRQSQLDRLADERDLTELREKAVKARLYGPRHATAIIDRMENANTFATMFGLALPFTPEAINEAHIFLNEVSTKTGPRLEAEKRRMAKVNADNLERERIRNEREREQKAALIARFTEARENLPAFVERWRTGELTTRAFELAIRPPYEIRHLVSDATALAMPTMLRAVGDTVETSLGAVVPVTHAERLYRLVKRREAKEGERVGHYALNEVTDTEVVIGCHHISWGEVELFAARMGWEEPPRDREVVDERMAQVEDEFAGDMDEQHGWLAGHQPDAGGA